MFKLNKYHLWIKDTTEQTERIISSIALSARYIKLKGKALSSIHYLKIRLGSNIYERIGKVVSKNGYSFVLRLNKVIKELDYLIV